MAYYPNPVFERKNWLDLNGSWEFAFDDEDAGLENNWADRELPMNIQVPFVYQCEKSGINDKSYHPVVWYRRSFELDSKKTGGKVLLNFNGVDNSALVFINGRMVGTHEGGYTAFSLEISAYIREGLNTIAVRAEDRHDPAQCRGKQIWTAENWGCWYTPSTGIWKDVWLSFTGKTYIRSCMITPDIENCRADFELEYPSSSDGQGRVEIELFRFGEHLTTVSSETVPYRQKLYVQIPQRNDCHYIDKWSPENPVLYDAVLRLYDSEGKLTDSVNTYFGMRKVTVSNGQILINGKPLYQRLILDQGYWKYSLLTAPSKDELKRDLELIKAMGFNGVRMHQKIEDPWFYRFADLMGLVVWAELPSPYYFCTDEMLNVQRDMSLVVKALYNHPSVITWVPFNESWGVNEILSNKAQQQFVISVFHMLKAMDPNRLVSANDGWEHPIHDFIAIHDYSIRDEKSYRKKWDDFDRMIATAAADKQILADCDENHGAPVLLTEFGGIAIRNQVQGQSWGYFGPASSAEDLEEKLKVLLDTVYADSRVKGFCYTQLTDVQQEVNGLLDENHNPKCDVQVLNGIFSPRQ